MPTTGEMAGEGAASAGGASAAALARRAAAAPTLPRRVVILAGRSLAPASAGPLVVLLG